MSDPFLDPILERIAQAQASSMRIGTVTAIDAPDGSLAVALAGGQGTAALLPTAYDYADSTEHREGIAAFLAKRSPNF